MPGLTRITTEYDQTEDRFCLRGSTESGDTLSLWLSQRLLIRIVLHLTQWLESDPATEMQAPVTSEQARQQLQSFEQQAAQAELVPEQPVIAEESSDAATSWLVQEVDIQRNEHVAVGLAFKNPVGEHATLQMSAQQLRQWLGIVHRLWQTAEWPMTVWPVWVSGSGDSDSMTSGPFH